MSFEALGPLQGPKGVLVLLLSPQWAPGNPFWALGWTQGPKTNFLLHNINE